MMGRNEAVRLIKQAVRNADDVQAIDLLEAVRVLERYLNPRGAGGWAAVPPNDPEAAEALEAGSAILEDKMEAGFDPMAGLRPAAAGGVEEPEVDPSEPQTLRPFVPGQILDRPGGVPVDPSGEPVDGGTEIPASALGPGIPVQQREDISGARAAQRDEAAMDALHHDFVEAGRRAGVPEDQIYEAWQNVTLFPHVDAYGNSRDPAEVAAEIMAQWEAMIVEAETGAPLAPPGITLPDGFTAPREVTLDSADRARFGSVATANVEVAPRYFAEDALSPLSLGEEELVELQEAMVEAGVLDPDSYHVGFWDADSTRAYATVLGYANYWGLTPEETLGRLAASLPEAVKKGRTSAAKQQILADAYVAPDYATLNQQVKQMFRSRLGREPTDKELGELAGSLAGWDRAGHDARVALEAEAEALAEQGIDPATASLSGSAVDPVARLGELFDQRFGAEERRLQGLDDVRANMNNMFASLTRMQTMMGGG